MFCFWKKKKNVQSDALVRSHPGTENRPSVGLKPPVKTNLGAPRADTVSLLRSMEFSDNKDQRTAKPDKKTTGAAPPESQTQSDKKDNLETKSKELISQLPEELKRLLPDTDQYYLREYHAGDLFVEYYAKNKEKAFISSYHPFICRYAKDLAHSASLLLQYMRYPPYCFKVYDSVLIVRLHTPYWVADYAETPEYMVYDEWRQESQHDGGGSCDIQWVLCKAKVAEQPFSIPPGEETTARALPPCRSFWFDDKRCFVVDPWDVSGVFEFYYRWEYSESYNSASEISEIGDPNLQGGKWKRPLSLYMQNPRRQ